jgi:hypothetical protein
MTTTSEARAPSSGPIRSLVPARLDRLPWSPFHTRMVAALGVAWILDGLEITVASAVMDTLTRPETLALSVRWSARCGSAGSPTGWAGAGCSWSHWPST